MECSGTRWQLEVTFHELRTHVGVETQRQWIDLAILRSTPTLFGRYFAGCPGHPTSPWTRWETSCLISNESLRCERYIVTHVAPSATTTGGHRPRPAKQDV